MGGVGDEPFFNPLTLSVIPIFNKSSDIGQEPWNVSLFQTKGLLFYFIQYDTQRLRQSTAGADEIFVEN